MKARLRNWARVDSFLWPILLLALFAFLSATSIANKSATFDETIHIAGGIAYWTRDDYRVQPENGVLSQRLIALPVLALNPRLPPPDDADWKNSRDFLFAQELFYESGNDPNSMLWRGRMAVLFCAVLLGVTIYAWTRRLFDAKAAILATILFAFSPTVIAHSRLATSDIPATLFLTLFLYSCCALTKRLSWLNILVTGLCLGAVMTAKTSGLLGVPVLILAVLLRVLRKTPIETNIWGRRLLHRARTKWAAASITVLLCGTIAFGFIWGMYGFRQAAINPASTQTYRPKVDWSEFQHAGMIQHSATLLNTHHVLPEAFLFGIAYVDKFSKGRQAYFMGQISSHGSPWFFPLSLLIKTPIPTLIIALIALVLAIRQGFRRRDRARRLSEELTPLRYFAALYMVLALASGINIGIRHLLPLYPPVFMACGWALAKLPQVFKAGRCLVATLTALLAIEMVAVHPNYLSYFNALIGGPEQGHHYLLDSSLDWGQDLNRLAQWLQRNPSEGPTYLAYFGTASPPAAGIQARRLATFGYVWKPQRVYPLEAGRYLISASLHSGYIARFNIWRTHHESRYRILDARWRDRLAAAENGIAMDNLSPSDARALSAYESLRFFRLTALLKQRHPDASIGHSILVYEVSESDVQRVLEGPVDSVKF